MYTANLFPSCLGPSKPLFLWVRTKQAPYLLRSRAASPLHSVSLSRKSPSFCILDQKAPFFLSSGFGPASTLHSACHPSYFTSTWHGAQQAPSIWVSTYHTMFSLALGLESPLPSGFVPRMLSFWVLAQQAPFLVHFTPASPLAYVFRPCKPLPSAFRARKPHSFLLLPQQAPFLLYFGPTSTLPSAFHPNYSTSTWHRAQQAPIHLGLSISSCSYWLWASF